MPKLHKPLTRLRSELSMTIKDSMFEDYDLGPTCRLSSQRQVTMTEGCVETSQVGKAGLIQGALGLVRIEQVQLKHVGMAAGTRTVAGRWSTTWRRTRD